jgi:HK97 family phage portal protein
MNFFGLTINRTRPAQPADTSHLSPQTRGLSSAAGWLRGEDAGAGGAVLSNAYEQVVWVYRAINVLAEQVANIPFRFSIGAPDGDRLITSGPLPEFYAHPHPQIDQFQYWELRIIWLMLRGECLRVPIYSDSTHGTHGTQTSKLSSVLILDPAHFQHIVEDHQLIGWRYTGFGPQAPLAAQVLLPEEVWFEKLPNPFDFWRGLSPLQVAATAARTEFAAGAFMNGVIENNADTGIIVRTQEPLGDEQQEQLVAALRDRKRKAGVADRPLLLSGVTEVIKPELSSSDLQFLENRKFSRAEICAAFGVPEEIVTTTDTAKYDVMAGARLNFIENRVAPLCRRLEAGEEPAVKALDPAASGWFDLDSLPIMQEARRSRLATARAGFEMGVPFNELNRVLDLGFKPLPWGNRGYLAGKWQQVGREENPENRWLNADPLRQRGGAVRENSASEIPERQVHLLGSSLNRAGELLGRLIEPRPTAPDPRLTRKLHRFFFEQRARALAGLTAALGKIASSSAGHPPGPAAPPALLDLSAENASLLALIKPLLPQIESSAGPGQATVALGSPAASEAALLQTNQTTLTALQETFAAGLAAGETPEQLGVRVKQTYNSLNAETLKS